MNKLAQKITTFIIALTALIVVALPVYANDVQIDYAKEQIKGLTTNQEFSFNGSTWLSIYDTGGNVDISSVISNTKDITFSYRNEDGTGDTYTFDIPARPSAPSGIVFVPGADPSEDVISSTNVHEFKIGNSLWIPSSAEGVNVKTAITYGATFSVRTAATSSAFVSLPAKVTVPKQAVKPSAAKYDYKRDVVVVTSGMEYQVGAVRSAADMKDDVTTTDKDKWVSIPSSLKAIDRTTIEKALGDENGVVAATVYVRTKASTTKSASAITAIDVPSCVAAPSTVKLDISAEKLTGLSTKMEYRVLTDSTAATATISTPAWKSITASSLSLSKVFSPATSKAPVTRIQVRFKEVAGASSTATKPASSPYNIKVAKRAATPKVTDVVMNYTAGSESMTMASALEYKLATDTTWVDGGESISIASKIPVAGNKAAVLNVRVKAIEATDSDVANVPASAIISSVKIPAHPAAPKAVFNAKSKRITGVTSKMEYAIGSSTDFTPVTGTYIDLSEQSAGSTVTVKVRLMSTTKAPVSAEKTVSGTLPTEK